ncbi:unnamed protein product [Thlaspi arvense]|uniref:Mitochondrial transcription termination factor family protein n=1 Tax=Thlaspi arvense TaxID=13288 RepID=A0AAU9RPW1_THLAR|nr:unnamed protein product [Thlaspi arvense]
MFSLILHGKKSIELQKWRNSRILVKLFQNASSDFSSSSSSVIAHVSPPQDLLKGKTFTVSYLVDSLGFTTKLAESISRKVISEGKGNPDSVLSLLKSFREKFEESLKKVVEMGFDPTTSRFVDALRTVYALKEETIEEKVNVYREIGLSVGDVWEMFKKFPVSLTFSEKKITQKFETLKKCGLVEDEICSVFKRYPPCIGLSAENVKNKTEFLVKKMNWPVKSLISNPAVLGLSMEKRTVPRCNVIKALMSKGLLGEEGSELPRMQSVLVCTDEDFLKRYVRNLDDDQLVAELMSILNWRAEKNR